MSDRGFAGRLAGSFVHSKLTPVIAIASLMLGLLAVWATPKEEEPQISVPMIDIQTEGVGLRAAEVERRVTEPIERAVWGLNGVEYVYSASQPQASLVTVRFKVGEPMERSLVEVHHKLMSIWNSALPAGTPLPVVKSYSINDVPFLTLTFSSASRDGYSLRSLIAPLARELSSTPDLSRVDLLGGRKRAVRVIADPRKMAQRGVTLVSVAQAIRANDVYLRAGKTWGASRVFDVDIGERLTSAKDIANIAVGQRGGGIVRIGDIARVIDGPEARNRKSVLFERGPKGQSDVPRTAVSIAFAKRKGTNAVELSRELLKRARVFSRGLPADVRMSVMRDYGRSAAEKTHQLIEHLVLATLSVSILIALFMGIRASLVVAIAIPVTLALTLAIYYFLGFTLNRVTLFALIFSIGILVDDAIVVVENIERHLRMDRHLGLVKTTIRSVSEVGNPTILATFTVIAAILPMAFVRGLMGPYMKPIPVGASLAMILSLGVAFTVTPWASVKLLKKHGAHEGAGVVVKEGRLDRIYRRIMEGLLANRRAALRFGGLTIALLLAACSLLYFKTVKVKMLPFDNKDEFQVLVDYPPETSLNASVASSEELARTLLKDRDVEKVQIYGGEPAPYSFSGMVKHTFLRHADYENDLQVVLKDKSERGRSSHRIIEQLRPAIASFGTSHQAITKVLEIPPGPPVLATMVAEIYGPNRATRERVAKEVYRAFSQDKSVVDLDTSLRLGRPRKVYLFDPNRGGTLGTDAATVAKTGRLIFSESPLVSLSTVAPEDVNVDLSIDPSIRSGKNPLIDEELPSFESGIVNLNHVVQPPVEEATETLYRKNLKPVSYVTAELSGSEESPVYSILNLTPKIHYRTQTANVPWNTQAPVVKWDGEWFITYQVFRDLGLAFAVVLVLIYILVLGWFKSYAVPLIIMAPIPISLIGILPGHAILGAYFTATSMIGFIAGAGIIVRNSIILVDFIEHQLKAGMGLKEAVVSAGVLRFRPMLLTAAAVVVGSSVMLADPIFQGLAVSLMFGEVAATVLSRFAVPVLYYWIIGRGRVRFIQSFSTEEGSHDY